MVYAKTFEGQAVGDAAPGPVYRKLIEAWKKFAGLDFVAQARSYAERLEQWEGTQR